MIAPFHADYFRRFDIICPLCHAARQAPLIAITYFRFRRVELSSFRHFRFASIDTSFAAVYRHMPAASFSFRQPWLPH